MPEQKTIDFLAQARKRFEYAAEDEKLLREKFTSDLKFASPDGDEQWDPQLKLQREQAGRPAMSFPRCHTFVQQVSNEGRQNKPQIKFAPRLDTDEDTAKVYEGLARYIQYSSEASIAYETALEYSASGSFGYYRILTDYADEESDDQEIKILPVVDPLTIYGILVPAIFRRKPRYAFVTEEIPREEYKQLYPDSELASLPWAEAEHRYNGWVGSDAVRIAEYWTLEENRVKGKRRPEVRVSYCKTNGFEILPGDDGESSETEWLGSSIPIIAVLGQQSIIEGKPRLTSVVRPQKAAQQLINYSKSRIAETLSTAPVSPFIIAVGQIPSGKEGQWKNLNRAVTPYLEYEPVDAAGRPAPPPQRQVYEPPIQSLSAFVAQEVDDMKATTGIFDASLGNNANEVTGKAIMARQQSSNLTTMHFLDNLERSFRQAGDIIEELIPKIYDTAREVTILGEDETQKIVQINQPHVDQSGKKRHYNIADTRVKLVVTMGRAYDTKRMESFDMLQTLVQSAPNLLPTFGDILFKNSDVAGADIVADRFKAMLPPQLQGGEQNEMPPEARAAVAQAQQQMGMMGQELQKLQFEKTAKVVENQGKLAQIQAQLQADMQLEDKKMMTQITVAEIQTKAQDTEQRLTFVEDMLKQFHQQSHETALHHSDHMHEHRMAEQTAQHAIALADTSAAHASMQSAQDAAQAQVAQANTEGAAQ